ncbi:WhiB family transcriptional regulator [Amycolatopsis taiwanensis]|uniref:WhiB family transcriptional regulator n=1 Tax=Amycolatopsis taiwanensis TaxID=342230 RepID=UPI0004870DC8|nr:WhiB family transcriptional regulator [Amycolatopsis taiwanensis]
MTSEDIRLIGIAWRLDRLRWVPTRVLDQIVKRDGSCFWMCCDGEPPQLVGIDTPDRELAARLCAGCRVPEECLELELRTAGELTVGVWGAMPEDDRRALYPHWLRRGERAGGPRP